MLMQNGGITKVSQTLQILYAKLDNFKKYGAPRIPHIPLSKEEMDIASGLFCEGYDFPCKSQIFKHELDTEEEDSFSNGSYQSVQCSSRQSFGPRVGKIELTNAQ